MSDYLIIPADRPDWRIEPETLASAIVQQWPSSYVGGAELPGSTLALRAEIPIGQDTIEVTLNEQCDTIGISPDRPEAAAAFTAWYVQHAPGFDPDLRLYNKDFVRSLSLTPTTSRDEVLELLTH